MKLDFRFLYFSNFNSFLHFLNDGFNSNTKIESENFVFFESSSPGASI